VVNKDQTSDYFGTIYFSGSLAGTCTAGRTTDLGIYVLTIDRTDAVGQGDSALAGGVAWTGGGSGPYRLELDEGGKLLIADWTDNHSGVWRANAGDCSGTFDTILTEAGRDANGLCTNHGSICDLWVEGTGATTVLYTRDEDGAFVGETIGSVLKYDVGTATDYSALPTLEASDGGKTANHTNGIAKDAAGDWWLSQYRYTQSASLPWLIRVDGTSGAITYDSFADGGWLGANTTARVCGGVGLNADDGILGLCGYAKIPIFDIATLSEVATLTPSGSWNRDATFDSAGNLYVVNSSAEVLRVFSPPDGSNSAETECPTSQQLVCTAPPSTGVESTNWEVLK